MDGLGEFVLPDELRAAGLMVPDPSVMLAPRPFVCAEYMPRVAVAGGEARQVFH